MWHSYVRTAKTVLIFALGYLMADIALNRFAFSDGWSIVWPLNGVTVALLLMRPRSTWPWILLGVELGTGVGEWFDRNLAGLEICQRCCSATEVLICAYLLPPFSVLEEWLRTPRIKLRLLSALVLGPGISGLLAAALFHSANGQPYLLAFNDWATADALGIAATLPLVLSIRSPQLHALFRGQALLKTMGTLSLTFAGSAMIFSVSRYPLLFLLYPLLLLVDSLLAFAGSAIAIVGVCLISVYFTTQGVGPFGVWPRDLPVTGDFALQLYFGFHLVALFPASLMFMERKRMAAELRDTNARLTILASLDGLTGLANRRSFDERFAQEWKRAVRSGQPLALAMIDLDNFKQFNDLYGHLAGDGCLRAVAEAIAAAVQRREDLVARYGGEEFVLLMPHTPAEGACTLAERVRSTVLDLAITHLGNSWGRVSISIGYASINPTPTARQTELIQLADAAMYQAKRLGRNCVETVTSIEGLRAANDQVGETTRTRLLRLIGRGE